MSVLHWIIQLCIGLILVTTNSLALPNATKCCPLGMELSIGELNEFKCIPGNSTFQFIGINVIYSNQSNIPQCESIVYSYELNLGDVKRISGNCIDVYSGNYIYLACSNKSEHTFQSESVIILNKCCSNGYSYNTRHLANYCSNKTNDLRLLKEHFPETIVLFNVGVPMCKRDHVLVDNYASKRNFKFRLNSILFRSKNRYGHELQQLIGYESYCVDDLSEIFNDWIIKSCRPKAICEYIPCVQRCCSFGEAIFRNGSTKSCGQYEKDLQPIFHELPEVSEKVTEESWSIVKQRDPGEFGIIHEKVCQKFVYSEDELTYLDWISGNLRVFNNQTLMMDSHQHDYCIEFYNDRLLHFGCFPKEDSKSLIFGIMLSISCVFLFLTLAVYAAVPKLMNLHGKTLCCHVFSLLITYASLASLKLNGNSYIPYLYCHTIGYIVYFNLLAAFSWLNVMCIDIWYTFGSVSSSRGMRKNKERLRFAIYSVYAWGFPAIMIMITYLFEHYQWLPPEYTPHIGTTGCFFQNLRMDHIIFFLIPVGTQILINFILFVLTSVYCNKVKGEIHRMKTNDAAVKKKKFIADKTRLIMNLKLFFVMGVTWVLEIICTSVAPDFIIWQFTDALNSLKGVLIFIIFVCKSQSLRALKIRLGLEKAKPIGTTMVTTTTSFNDRNNCIDPYAKPLARKLT